MTEPRFLLDTNICIYLIEGLSDRARDRVEALAPGEVVASVICYAEVMRGVDHANAHAMKSCERFFRAIEVMDFGRRAADEYARLPFRRNRYDRLIAAHTLALGAVLVTNNVADFADVPTLKVENWTV